MTNAMKFWDVYLRKCQGCFGICLKCLFVFRKLDSSLAELFKTVETVMGKLPAAVPKYVPNFAHAASRNAVLNIKESILDVMKNWPVISSGTSSAARLDATAEINAQITRIGDSLSAVVIKLGMEPHPEGRRGAAVPSTERRGAVGI